MADGNRDFVKVVTLGEDTVVVAKLKDNVIPEGDVIEEIVLKTYPEDQGPSVAGRCCGCDNACGIH